MLMSREDIINTENGSELLLMQGTVLLTWKEGITDEEKEISNICPNTVL